MAKSPIYSEDAILYRHRHKTIEGLTELVGTDPAEQDRNRLYQWLDRAGGWAECTPRSQPADELLERVHNNAGKASGWPGAIPLDLPKRPVGRPPGPPKVPAEPREVLHVSIKRTSMLKILQRAAQEQKMPNEWATAVIEAALQEGS